MFQLSKLWGKWLLASQYANFALMLLAAFASGDTDITWLQQWKRYALELHGGIAAFIGTLQAVAKSLTDADGNGVPDIFEGKVAPPSEGA